MKEYTTVSGDTFDKIALQELGSEYLFPLLLKENPKYRDTVIFSAGVVLSIPEITASLTNHNVPNWLLSPLEDSEEEEIVVLTGIDE